MNQNSGVDITEKHKKTRMEYKAIRSNLEQARMEKRGLGTVREAIPQVEQTYRRVDRTNEAVLDTVVVAEMSAITAEETRRLELDSILSFNVNDYITALASFLSTPTATDEPTSTYSADSSVSGLARLGMSTYGISLRPPMTDFMIGPLAVEHKVRTVGPRQRRVIDEEAGKAAPTQLQLDDIQHGKKMPQIIKEIYDKLEESGASEATPVGLFEFVLNPDSFSQSVENLFYLSFLVHDGKVILDIDDYNVPIISLHNPLPQDPVSKRAEERRRASAPARQMIFDLDHEAWKDLCEAFGITQPIISHRQPGTAREVNPENPRWYS